MTKLLCILVFLLLSCGVVEAKEVIIPYDDFLVMVSKVEHKDKLLNQCMAEREILVKLNDENGTIKKLNLQQVEALQGEVEAHRKLGETQEQIVQAVEQKLAELTQRLESEKSKHKWYAIGGTGIGVVIGLVIMAVMQ